VTDKPSKAALLADAGRLLFGPAWQSELARLLKVSLRRIQYYAADARQPPASMLAEVAVHLKARARDCQAMSTRLEAAAADAERSSGDEP